jgi:antirestriction protein ArdC
MKKFSRTDAYDSITSRVIEMMETHGAKWTQPWVSSGLATAPVSVTTGDAYRGINRLLLGFEGRADTRWGTYKAWAAKGAQVRNGEKGTQILFFKPLQVTDKQSGEEKKIRLAKVYTVFSAEQVEGAPELPQVEPASPVELIDHAEHFLQTTGASISLGGDQACYSPLTDRISCPHPHQFHSAQGYYSTLLHELVHWTGHKSREARDQSGRFRSSDYAFEELVAELGATFLCADLGIESEPREDHAGYLASWLKVLRDDKRAIVKAAKLAQAAADHLHALQADQQQQAA